MTTVTISVPEWITWVINANAAICFVGAAMMILYLGSLSQKYGKGVAFLAYVLILAMSAIPTLVYMRQTVYLFVCEMVVNLMWTVLLYRSGGNIGVLLEMIANKHEPPSAPNPQQGDDSAQKRG